ncbi:MAG: polysaccharide biosynthesis/export family protein [Planctomycetota bacterium]|jgi:protein involved in polysaccharide export with SLBB domain
MPHPTSGGRARPSVLWTRAALACGAVLAALGARAGEPEALPAPPRQRDVYRIAPGDTIAVTVIERADLSTQVLVPREGTVVLPGAGVVQASGSGVEDLARDVAALLAARERLRDARVVVSIVAYGSRKAFIFGSGAGAQAVDLPAETDTTLLQAIAASGGFAADADRERVRITRRPSGGAPRVITVDARAISSGEAPALDPVLEPGDVVHVPKREPVYVLGQVKQQGALSIPFEYPLTASKAIALSGGFTPYARHNRVSVSRRTAKGVERFTVDAGAVLAGGDLDADMKLESGDMVYVPERIF